MKKDVLKAEGLCSYIAVKEGLLRAVEDVSLCVRESEIVGVTGESGAGKSRLAAALTGMDLEPPGTVKGRLWWYGCNVLEDIERFTEVQRRGKEIRIKKDHKKWDKVIPQRFAALRGRTFSMIFQESQRYLSPYLTVREHLNEVLKRTEKNDGDGYIQRLLERVGLPFHEELMNSYPHQLSGGMCQRLYIAMAAASGPKMIIADEPTASLDVTGQAVVNEYFDFLKEKGLSILYISHNLAALASCADWMIVLYGGMIMEEFPVIYSFEDKIHHPYTKSLWRLFKRMGGKEDDGRRLPTLPGEPHKERFGIQGCVFSDRCLLKRRLPSEKQRKCESETPPLKRSATEVSACRCWWSHPGH